MAGHHVQALDDLLTTFAMEMAETGRDLAALTERAAEMADDPERLEQLLADDYRRRKQAPTIPGLAIDWSSPGPDHCGSCGHAPEAECPCSCCPGSAAWWAEP